MICKKDELIINYYPSYKCNFSCDYCYVTQQNKNNNYTATTTNIDNLIKNLSKTKIKYFKIFGGEPLLYQNIEYLLQALSSSNNIQIIKMFTNGFLLDKLSYLAKKYKNVRFSYSIHPALTNLNEENIQKILIPNIKYNLVCDFRHKDKLVYYKTLLQKYNVDVHLIKIYIEKHHNNNYSSSEQFDDFYQTYFKENKIIENYKGIYCYNNCVTIHSNGNIQYGECHNHIKPTTQCVYDKPFIHIPRKTQCLMNMTCTDRCKFTYKEY